MEPMQQNIGSNQIEHLYGKLHLPISTITTTGGGNTKKQVVFIIIAEIELLKPLNYLNIDQMFLS